MRGQRPGKRCSEQGSVLVVTLFVCTMFGLFLGAYFYLARQQNNLVQRSQGWNGAIAVAEAGVEEALAQLNPGASVLMSWGGALSGMNFSANNWGNPQPGGFYGPQIRTLPSGSVTSSYSVVYTTDTLPIIYSTGYVTIPALSATFSRTVRVTTTNVPLFSAGLVGINGIDFNGANITTDSTNLLYPSLTQGTNGDIATLNGVVNVNSATVNGTVYLGPTATNSLKSAGVVTGGVSNDFNVEFESVVLPQGTSGWVPPNSGTTTFGTNTYQYAFGPGTPNPSLTNDVHMGGGTLNGVNFYVGTNTHVRLLITGNASPSDIKVAGAGTNAGQLTIYMDGPTFKLAGNQTVDGGGTAQNVSYYGTTNNTSAQFTGTAAFVGTIYAPQANIKVGGGGAFWGAIVGNTITMSGNGIFHFDESLLGTGAQRFIASSWQEL